MSGFELRSFNVRFQFDFLNFSAAVDLNAARVLFTGSKNGNIVEFLHRYNNILMRKSNDDEKAAGTFSYLFSDALNKYKSKFIDW